MTSRDWWASEFKGATWQHVGLLPRQPPKNGKILISIEQPNDFRHRRVEWANCKCVRWKNILTVKISPRVPLHGSREWHWLDFEFSRAFRFTFQQLVSCSTMNVRTLPCVYLWARVGAAETETKRSIVINVSLKRHAVASVCDLFLCCLCHHHILRTILRRAVVFSYFSCFFFISPVFIFFPLLFTLNKLCVVNGMSRIFTH